MLDFRDYYLNNDDEMEALIVDYIRNQKKLRQRVNASENTIWPFHQNESRIKRAVRSVFAAGDFIEISDRANDLEKRLVEALLSELF